MDELTEAELAELHEALVALRDELAEMLDSSASGAKPVDLDEPIGRLSRMDAMQQQSMVVANRAAAEARLAQVRRALEAHAEEEYGWCRSCDEPIGIVRLRARPEAPLCVRCQDRAEQRR
ncbi:MAG: TraR/DksA family transcriptional regulator [Acidobacteriota bacterium]